jgi:hypothetical protein
MIDLKGKTIEEYLKDECESHFNTKNCVVEYRPYILHGWGNTGSIFCRVQRKYINKTSLRTEIVCKEFNVNGRFVSEEIFRKLLENPGLEALL